VAYIGTSKNIWISWKSPHWELIIDMHSKSNKNSSSEVSKIFSLQIHHNRSMEKEIPMEDKARRVNLKKIILIHQLIWVMRIQEGH
jgi:hypothetical protein